jgi:hypothetical protein
MRKTIDETADEHGASIFVIVCGSRFTKMAAFDLPIALESHGIAVALLSQRGKFPSGGKCHANRKSHKIVKARLESCCLG